MSLKLRDKVRLTEKARAETGYPNRVYKINQRDTLPDGTPVFSAVGIKYHMLPESDFLLVESAPDDGKHCPECGERHTRICINGARCVFCGRSLP